jgi:hypothetical protein
MTVLTRTPQNTNYLQATKFLLTIDRITTTQYFCQSVNLPGLSLGQITYNTPTLDLAVAGNKLTYNPLTIRFTIDEQVQSWKELHTWFLSIASPNIDERNRLTSLQNKRNTLKNYSDGTLTILSALNNPIMNVRFVNLFPTSLSDIQFDTQSSADNILTADATFYYQQFDFATV